MLPLMYANAIAALTFISVADCANSAAFSPFRWNSNLRVLHCLRILWHACWYQQHAGPSAGAHHWLCVRVTPSVENRCFERRTASKTEQHVTQTLTQRVMSQSKCTHSKEIAGTEAKRVLTFQSLENSRCDGAGASAGIGLTRHVPVHVANTVPVSPSLSTASALRFSAPLELVERAVSQCSHRITCSRSTAAQS